MKHKNIILWMLRIASAISIVTVALTVCIILLNIKLNFIYLLCLPVAILAYIVIVLLDKAIIRIFEYTNKSVEELIKRNQK